jgi:hypothetical protein
MSSNVTTFEVRVRVDSGKPEYKPIKYSSKVKGYYGKVEWACEQVVKMFHIPARTHEQAKKIARRKYGEPISCHKLDVMSHLSNIENLKLDQPVLYGAGSPYKNAIAMDEKIWEKRNKRRNNMHKDKGSY